MNRLVTIYRCDRCLDEVEVRMNTEPSASMAPKGWHHVKAEAMDGSPAEAQTWELCGGCFTQHLQRALAPVERVSDLQRP